MEVAMGLVTAVVSVALEIAMGLVTAVALGRGRAIEVEGPSLMLVRRTLGKIGLPGRGFGAVAFGATFLSLIHI